MRLRYIIVCEFHIHALIIDHNLKSGIYKARVKYENRYGADKGVYNGRLISNWVTFEVTETEKNNIRKTLGRQ